jgi:hypothetical protein
MDGLPMEDHENLPYGNFAGMGDLWTNIRDQILVPTVKTAGVSALSALSQTPGGQELTQQLTQSGIQKSGYALWDWMMANPKKAALYALGGVGGVTVLTVLLLRGLKK